MQNSNQTEKAVLSGAALNDTASVANRSCPQLPATRHAALSVSGPLKYRRLS